MLTAVLTQAPFTGYSNLQTNPEDLKIDPIIPTAISQVEGVGNLRALAVLEDTIAWIGGTEGTLAKTEDKGNSWSLCSLPEKNLDIRGLHLFDVNTACAMCAGEASKGLARIYRTTDGGETWCCTFSPEKEGVFFNSMAFWDQNNGILLSDPIDGKFVLFSTEDGGKTWIEINFSNMPLIQPGEIAFAASNSCLSVQGMNNVWFGTGGSCARVFYSRDRGQTWDVAQTPMQVTNQSSGIFSLAFNENQGIAVGGNHRQPTSFNSCNIMITNDGGKNWEAIYVPELDGKYLSSVVWTKNGALAVDGSQRQFNAAATTEKGGWVVGPDRHVGNFDI